ncbi:MAG: UDP-N-acetylglucosamine--N-acetylmuramyl-(pentapeptide) pyrophosphoryl-undecaprenol N-acetylglucosamine transferase [Candidatus Peribacteraceae bacterium]|jgi:UDP-N-acetylglucosamine--N-acetylmuramyl-(pentapeptide) pyrophosphoryl-undecaprenol N-acetylglucosamine transferase|nr:UDP-N-acetylglucosamine--N-acetylmuramyl-(pentapeptide) pyrophosphoryl-undecaprenol N-acetylglucosamine transferase [Candidatus Peribacteraceae bacterium]|tara:strand:- start:2817 stop:3887 length:1071 start_codon:yes stop_codon:yes gene_type:complete
MPLIAFAGGGSAGHIAPSVSVAKVLKEERPDVDVYFVCSTKPADREFIEKEGFNCSGIEAPRLSLTFPWKFFKAVKASKKILKELNPDVLFSKGGYVSVPVAFAAKRMKIPIVMHESDAVSGRANRVVSKWADHVCYGLPTSLVASHLSFVRGRETRDERRETFVGNPIRESVIQGKAEEGFRIAGLEGRSKSVIFIMGGSQGAEAINEFVKKHIDELLEVADVIHLTGKVKSGAGEHEGYYSLEFANEEYPHFFAASDLCISRAGANSITELAANSVPTILIPLRGVGHDHQQKNAELASQSEGFTIVQQSEMNEKLIPTINNILTNNLKPVTCNLYIPDATRQISKIILGYLES